jgi:hypothetical protein
MGIFKRLFGADEVRMPESHHPKPDKRNQDEQEGPLCPDCRALMVGRGEVAGSLGVGLINFTSTLYQCPKCKTVTIGESG